MFTRDFCHSHSKISFSARKRMNQLLNTHKWYNKNISPIPKNIKELGINYQPIVFKSEIPSHFNFSVYRYTQGYNPCKKTLLTEDQIVENVVKGILYLQNTCFLELNKDHRFLDPEEVRAAIYRIKQEGELIGFKSVFDLLNLDTDGYPHFFDSQMLMEDEFIMFYNGILTSKLVKRQDDRIFPWIVEITHSK